MVRKDVTDTLRAGGYAVVESPRLDVLYVRMVVTDLGLKRKKRGIHHRERY